MKQHIYSEEIPPLATKYGKPQLVCLVKNIYWAYVFWEITEDQLNRASYELGGKMVGKTLRILKGRAEQRQIIADIPIEADIGAHYVFLPHPGNYYQMEILAAGEDRMVTLLSSNLVFTPFDGVSQIEDQQWASIDELYQSYSQRLSAFVSGSPFRWNVSSPIFQPQFAAEQAEPGMELVVNTELILYGKATPNADVYIQGEVVRTNPDGSFSLRYALPEGCSIYPVKAVRHDGKQTKTIVPIITRETY